MTRLCVAIFVTDLAQARRDVALAAEAGADLVELRVDQLENPVYLQSLVGDRTVPAIVTCRPTWEGGLAEVSDEERGTTLRLAANAGAAFVDLELKTVQLYRGLVVQALTERPSEFARLIVSSHDFVGRPARINNLVQDLQQAPADIIKIVWTARTIRDNIEAFEILQHQQKPTIALCMGEAGLISRVLTKKFNGFLTFASLDAAHGTASGQISIDDMKRLYRWDAIDAQTKVYGVVGSPVAHSMSPAMHNAGFDHIGFNGVYLPLLVEKSYESFKAFMESFLAFAPLHLSGLSITIPHKENALRYLKEKGAGAAEVEPLAERIGALNTIVIDWDLAGGAPRLRGFSSDYPAILDCITEKLGIGRDGLAGKRVAVIGAGGTGRTAVAALAAHGATVVVYNRTRDRADALAAEFNGMTGKVVAAPLEKLCDSCCEIYLNTTSLGMHPHVDASAWGQKLPALAGGGAGTLAFDAVYNPLETRFLQQARAAGASTIDGGELLVRQAGRQFQEWTGQPAPMAIMSAAMRSRLARNL
jgi:3-dehydroquinate dehydratase/shikimate dehydrogenase